jgi:diadenosine tetraphosphate (Ap4A) HIT family hydrolase
MLAFPRIIWRFGARMTESAGWALHPQLDRDTVPVGDLPLCRVALINDATYPWILLVPRRRGIVEIFELEEADQLRLTAEIVEASLAIKAISACDKVNVAALGNVVSQLHVHVIARSRGDAAWPRPVWGVAPARSYEPKALQSRLAELRQQLRLSEV